MSCTTTLEDAWEVPVARCAPSTRRRLLSCDLVTCIFSCRGRCSLIPETEVYATHANEGSMYSSGSNRQIEILAKVLSL